jgi:hypothetical protein
MARGIDQVRTCGAQNGFRILEQHGLILGYKVLKFPAFVRGETSLIVLVEEPVKPCLALDVESLQLDRYSGFSDGTGHKFYPFRTGGPDYIEGGPVCQTRSGCSDT